METSHTTYVVASLPLVRSIALSTSYKIHPTTSIRGRAKLPLDASMRVQGHELTMSFKYRRAWV